MSSTIDALRETVLKAVRAGPLSSKIDDVLIEPDVDEEGNEFLRVLVKVRAPDQEIDEELEALLENIEAVVLDVDDRYPSVRFLDAA